MAGTQRKSILQSIVEKYGTEGLNKSYVEKSLANGGGFGATAGGIEIDENGYQYIRPYNSDGSRDRTVVIDRVYNQAGNPTVTIDDANKWFDDAYKLFQSMNSYAESNKDIYNRDYGSSYSSQIAEMMASATGVEDYLYSHRSEIGNYDELYGALKEYREALKQYDVSSASMRDYYSQWESEDQYNWQKTYQDKSYDELSEVLKNLDNKSDEYEWVSSFAAYKDTQEKLAFDTATAQQELEALTARYEEAKALKNEYNRYASGAARDPARATSALTRLQKYGDLEELEREITERTMYLNQAQRLQENEKRVSEAVNASDFRALSGYNSTINKDAKWWQAETTDELYEWINDRNGFRDKYEESRASSAALIASTSQGYALPADATSRYTDLGYDKLTEDEIAIFNYYYAKDGKEAAQQYLDGIQESLNYRMAEEIYKPMEDKTALQLVFGVQAGLDQFGSGLQALFSEEGYIPPSAMQMASQMVRGDLEDNGAKLPDWLGGASVGQMAYDAVTTTSNMLPSILASTASNFILPGSGTVVGSTLLGASAAGNAYQEMLNLGYDKGQARSYSMLVGASEAGLQALLGGIDKLSGGLPQKAVNALLKNVDNAFARVAINMGVNMASEFTEEYLQEVLSPWFQNLTLNTENDVKLFTPEALYSGLLGALTAGVMEGPSTIVGEVKTYNTGKEFQQMEGGVDRLTQLGKTFSADSVAHQLAGRVNENTGAYTIGRLFNEIGATLTEQNQSEIMLSLERKGITHDNAETIAETLAAVVDGKALNARQAAIWNANKDISKTIMDVIVNPNSTVNQRAEGYNKALMDLAVSKAGGKVSPAAQASAESKTEAVKGKSTSDIEAPSQRVLEASEDGKTTLKESGEEVKIKGIASIKDGVMTLELEDGSKVDSKEVLYASDGEALVYETVAGMNINAAAANTLVQKYTPTMNAEVYSRGIQEAYRYGMYSIPMNEMATRGAFSKDLDVEQRNTAYRLGQIFREGNVDAQTKAVRKAYEKAQEALRDGDKKRKRGRVKFHDGIKAESFTDQQKVVLDEAKVISAALGINIHFYSGMKEYGKYVKGTGSIWLNVNANISGQTLMQNTLAHELVHFASEWSPDKFKAFADFLITHYGKEGMSVEQAILAKQKEYAEDGIELTEDEAYEELIAEAASTMLTDSNAVETLAKLNPDIVQRIKGFLQGLLNRIQEYFGQLPADSPEAQRVREMEQETQKILQNLFTEMLVDAGEHYSTISKAFGKNTVIETNAEGEFLLAKNDGNGNQQTDILFNAATWERGGRDTLETALRNEGFSAEDVKAALTIMDAKYELVKQLGEEYSEQDRINKINITTDIKNGQSVVSALVTNGDYPVNIDLLMVCKKRQAYQKVINRLCETGMIQKATVDSLAIAEINKILGKYGFETACLGCFVESRRLRVQEWAETITKEWNAEVKKRNPNAKAFGFGKGEASLTQDEVMQLVAELESGGEKNEKGNLNLGTGSAVKRMGVLMDKVPSLQKTLSIEDLITPEGLTALRQFDSNLFSMVKSRYGSNSPKYVQDFNPYNSELAKYGKVPSDYKSLREYLYAIGGARMQSFSDFIVENWFDYAQIVADLAARKLPMHTYTKEIALARLFGMTGIKVNMSLIPDIDRSLGKDYAGLTLNENGEYELIWADKDRFKATGGKSFMQSINFADAIALQDDPRYSANVGTIAVGISDNHILKMLDDPRIRMIIPYHSSGMNPIYADIVGSSYYKDYTMSQNTSVAYLMDSKGNRKSLKLTKPQIAKLTAGFEFNKTLQELGDARATAEAYKEWCRDASQHSITINGETYTAVLTPKFNQFANHENYYKLLEDFNTYDCITEQAAPQGDVTQTYPEDFDEILKAEIQSRDKYRQKQDPKFNDAMAEIEAFLEKHSKADTVHYAEQRGIKLGAKDKKLNATEKAKLNELRAGEKSMYRMPSGAANSQFSKAIEVFGTTTDFNEAGFILPGGEMLKFTDDKHSGERQYDHRAIGMAYGVDVDLNVNRGYNKDSNKHLDDFVENGGIRFDPGSLEFNFDAMMQMSKNVPITKEQERAIRDFIRWKKEREAQYNPDDDPLSLYRGPLALRIDFGGTSAVAISADRGELGIKTLTYEGGQINADRIIADIRHYYQTGEVRQPSLTAQFRYRMPSRANKTIPYKGEEDIKQDFGIRGLNDYVGVQKAVVGTLERENFFDGKKNIAVNDDSSMVVEITRDGIRETLGPGNNFQRLPRSLKLLKLVTIRELPDIIRTARLTDDNVPNEHNSASKLKYAYLVNEILVHEGDADVAYKVTVAIRKSQQKNKFWIHEIRAEKKEQSLISSGDVNPQQEYNEASVPEDNIAQPEDIVKNRISGEDSLNTRHLLANALESVAQNDIERNKIQQYKEKIDLVNAEERKLQELRAEIKELSFAKGPRDTERIKSLQFEAIQAANRINTIDRQLLRLEASKPLQAVLEREKAMAKKRAEQKGKEALEAYREKAAKTQRELLERVQQSRKNAKEGRDKTAMRHKIKDIVTELNNYLLKGTKDKHVMIGLQKAVAAALDAVNMDTVGAEERIAKLNAELIKAKTPEKIMEITRRIERVQAMGDKMSDRLAKLKAAYADIKDSDDPLIANSHDEVIETKIEAVSASVGETPLRDMTLQQLEDVYDLYKMVLTTIRNSNKAFKAAKGEEISVLGNNVMMEVEEVGGKKKLRLKGLDGLSKFVWNNFKPIYAFKAIGSKTLSRIFDSVRAGEDVWAKDVSEARAFFLAQSKEHGYDSWDFKESWSFKSSSGMDFSLSLEQVMSLYAYSKREQALDHLQRGGIVFDEATEVTVKTKLGIPLKFNPMEATAYNISPETLADITSKLSKEQIAFVDAMQEYLSSTMGEKGNEVSLEMYGVKLFKEKFYFPLKSATQYMAKAKEQQKGEVKIKNSGFSKETTQKANNPIVLTPFMDVWAEHVNDMSMYHSFVLPMEDFYRVFNYRTPTSETMATESVEMYIQNAYGKGATAYIEQLLKDLNGGARSDPTAGIINKMMGLFKKGAVFASASVVIQQPSAIARAMALIDSKYFAGKKLDSKRHAALWEEVKQYAPIAIIKEMGYFDTNVGKSTVDFIKAKEYDSWGDKMKGLVVDGSYRDEVLSKAPALADELAWCAIWEAVKRETAANHKGLKVGSEEFLEAAGERFTEVIVNTQVYDSVLSRSANMRSKDTGMKMATAFLAEPTTSINMVLDALIQGKRGNRKYARAAIGAVMASQILNAILVSFVYAGRDDDEDETYWEKYLGSLVAEIKDSFNLFTYIPFVKDIVSIVQGYDVERSDIAVISDLWKAYEQLGSDKLSAWRKVEGFAGSIAQLFGLPVKNIMRDARGLFQTVESFLGDNRTTAAGVGYAIKGAITGKDVSDRQQLYEAMVSGDTAHAERVKARFEDQSAVDSAIRKALRENDPRIHEAAVARYNGDIAEYTRIAKEIIAEGHFSQDYVVTAISTEMNTLKPDSEGSSGKAVGLYTDDDYFNAIVAGDTASAEIVKEGLIAADVAKGELESSAEDSVESSFVTNVKGSYLEGNLTAANVKTLLTKYGDLSADEATTKIAEWNFEAKYGYSWSNRDNAYRLGVVTQEQLIQATMEVKAVDRATATIDVRFLDFQLKYPQYSDLTKDQYKGYYAAVETLEVSPADVQIDVGTYAEYRLKRTSFKGVDKDGDGRADNGTVKAEVLAYINTLPLTSQQKDVLYFMNGWSAGTINEAPWH